MKGSLFIVLLVALLSCLVSVNADEKFKHNELAELNDSNFWDHVKSNERVFIKFYAPWCGHCKKLAPTWKNMAEANTHEIISYAHIDCTKSKFVCKAFGIKSYPTLNLVEFKTGLMYQYSGPRDQATLVSTAMTAQTNTPFPKETPVPTVVDHIDDTFTILRNDLIDVWNFRKNIMAVIFVSGFLLGLFVNFLFKSVTKSNPKQEKIN